MGKRKILARIPSGTKGQMPLDGETIWSLTAKDCRLCLVGLHHHCHAGSVLLGALVTHSDNRLWRVLALLPDVVESGRERDGQMLVVYEARRVRHLEI